MAVFAVLFSGAFILAGTDDVSATAGSSTIPTGEVTVTEDATYTLEVEDANKPADISLTNSTGTKVTVTINYTVDTVEDQNTPMFRGGTISVDDNVKLVLNMTYAGTGSIHSNMVVDTNITISGNGEVVFKESSNIEGQAWWNSASGSAALTMSGTSKLTFDGANGLNGITATLSGTSQITVNNVSAPKVWMSFKGLTDAAGTKIISSDSKAGVYFSSETIVNGTIDAKNSEVRFATGSNTVNGKIDASTVTIGTDAAVSTGNGGAIDAECVASNISEAARILNGSSGISEVTISGDSALSEDITIPENKTLIIKSGTITGDHKISVKGTLSIDNSYIYVGVDVDEESGEFIATNTHKLTSTGTLNSDTKVGFGDELTLSGTVPAGINVYAFGTLIVDDLTVSGTVNAYIGSDVVINGKVTVANEFIMNDAKLNLAGTIEVKNDKNGGASFELVGESELTVAESGSFRVLKGTANSAAVNKLVIGDDADFIVEGTLDVTGTLQGTVKDKGTINFNGTSAEATVIVYDGIEFSPVSVTGKMTVSTKGIVKDIDERATNVADGSTVELNDVKGVKIVSSVDVKKNKAGTAKFYFCNLTVSGTFTAVSKDATASVKVTAENTGLLIDDSKKYATITVADAVALGENVTFVNAGALTVDGTITAVNKNAAINNTGTIIVNGLITVKIGTGNASITEGTINSVEYTITDSEGTVTQYYSGFAAAVDAIATADEKTITVKNAVTASADAEIPADAIIAVDGTLTVKAGSTLTVADGAVMNVTGTVKVGGTLVIANTDTGLTIGTLVYEVYSENGKTATYTSLANALKNAKEGDVITLSGNVTFSSDAEIPAGVTVNVGKNKVTLEKDVTLTVNGTLNFAKNSELVTTNAKDIVANGVISFYNGTVASALATMDIEGAYFVVKNVCYISNVAYAAENCHENGFDDGVGIMIRGNVVAGDVTFKAADSGLAITIKNENNEVFKAGKVTLDGATMTLNGKMTGTVAAQADGSEAVINLTNAKNIIIESTVESGVDGDVDKMVLSTTSTTTSGATPDTTYHMMQGIVEITSGAVTLGDVLYTPNEKSDVFKIASGATLDVPKTKTLTVIANSGAASLIVDGTLNVIGTMAVGNNAKAIINGTMTVLNERVTIAGELSVLGTLEMKDKTDDDNAGKVTVAGVLSVGQKTASVGAAGTVIGAVASGTGYVKVYPGADISAAKINWNPATEVSGAVSMDFTVNGTVYMTVYATDNTVVIKKIIDAEKFDITGVVNDGLSVIGSWYKSEEMKESQKLTDVDKINKDVPAVYAYAAAASVSGTITQGTGLELFIDGAKYNGERSLTVGTHTVSLGIKAGYDGTNASITFNGATVTDGKIVITADMTSFTLVASGAVPASSAVVVDDKDDGMGLTDILLVVLVVLIAVMAIMVALRMMRS